MQEFTSGLSGDGIKYNKILLNTIKFNKIVYFTLKNYKLV
jgi:hypothetical protein